MPPVREKSDAFVPVSDALVMFIAEDRRFFRVSVFAALATPTCCGENVVKVGVKVAPVPVP